MQVGRTCPGVTGSGGRGLLGGAGRLTSCWRVSEEEERKKSEASATKTRTREEETEHSRWRGLEVVELYFEILC